MSKIIHVSYTFAVEIPDDTTEENIIGMASDFHAAVVESTVTLAALGVDVELDGDNGSIPAIILTDVVVNGLEDWRSHFQKDQLQQCLIVSA